MRELSLNILDIVENSVKAEATLVTIFVIVKNNILEIKIEDNGKGMSEEFLNRVIDPYTTTRTTRKVGMGIPLFKMASEMAGGQFDIKSKLGVGTITSATFKVDHIDRPPLGNLGESIATLLSGENDCDFLLKVYIDGKAFDFDTRELKEQLGSISMNEPEILLFIKNMINENLNEIGGAML